MRTLACEADDAARILYVDPTDGATGVFCDALVVASLSHAVDAGSITPEAFAVEDAEGAVPGRSTLTPDGRCLVWRGNRLLVPGVLHRVTVAGLRDLRGRALAPHRSRFIPCDLTYRDVFA